MRNMDRISEALQTYAVFLKEVGDRKVTNPDTGNTVKVKSLKGPQGKKLLQEMFEGWKSKGQQKPEDPKPVEEAAFVEPNNLLDYGESWEPARRKWTPRQIEGLRDYTDSAFLNINFLLRKKRVDSGTHLKIEMLDTVFDLPESKTSKAVKVTRGVDDSHPAAALLASGLLVPGMKFTDPGFMSTTIKRKPPLGAGYEFELTVPKGTRAVYLGPPGDYSMIPPERELLLDRGTHIRITKVDTTGWPRIIYAEVYQDEKPKKASLQGQVIRLAYQEPSLRKYLVPLLKQAEADNTYAQFMKEKGNMKVRNPDTANLVKLRTLEKTEKGRAVIQYMFSAWKKRHDAEETAEKEENSSWVHDTETYAHRWETKRSQWTTEQVKAARKYTAENVYRQINTPLREGKPTKYSAVVEQLDALFDSPLGKTHRATMVVRGIGSDHPLVNLLNHGQLKKGMTFTDKGYTSTTIRDRTSFGVQALHISVPKGAEAIYLGDPPEKYSTWAQENELLLNRGTTIRITKVSNNYIEAEVVLDKQPSN